jgi:hypothetical protein
MKRRLGYQGVLHLGLNVFLLIFAYSCVPETKGLSLEQIDLLYQNVAPVNSVSYRKRLLAEGTELSQSKGAAPATTGRGDDLD